MQLKRFEDEDNKGASRFILMLDVENAFNKELDSLPEYFAKTTFKRVTRALQDKIFNRGYDVKRISNFINKWIDKFNISLFDDSQNIINTFCNYKITFK